jgi:hypothetical protein
MKTETVIFDTIIPHPDPVNIADLLADIETVIKKHVILSDHAAAALAVWVLHTYTFELRDTVAYVAIESPEKRCGKTTLLSVLAAMACKSLIASNITVGALFRAIHTCTPTLFIDEADTFLAGNSIMRGIINSGNTRRTAYVLRLSSAKKVGSASRSLASPTDENRPVAVPSPLPFDGRGEGQGEVRVHQQSTINHQPPESTDSGLKKYSCWCPKVIAMIGEVPDTIADRSIVVKMARKLTTEACLPLAALDAAEIKAKCTRFALDMGHFISSAPKISAEGLNDRASDTFDPLFVIARLAGSEWEHKLRAASLGLSSTADTENSGSGLILDIIDIFVENGWEKIFTRDLVPILRDGGLKSQALRPGNINEHHISKILRHYGIKPDSVRIGKEVKNGYLAGDFRNALHRYVSTGEIQARVERLRHRVDLNIEARKEEARQAAEQQAMLQKLVPMMRKAANNGIHLTEYEIKEMIHKLKREQEMAVDPAPLGTTCL